MKHLILYILTISALSVCAQKNTGSNSFSIRLDGAAAFQVRIKDTSYHFDGNLFVNKSKDENYDFQIDCGTYNFREEPSWNFQFKNHIDTPLFFTRAYWGEPFMSPDYAKEPILKGQTRSIVYTARHIQRQGPYQKTATFYTNRNAFTVRFAGNILPPTLFLDKSYTMQAPGKDNKIHTEFSIQNKGMENFKVDSIRTDKNTVVTTGNMDAEGKKVFKVTHKPAGKGNSVSRITVYINNIKVEHDLFITSKIPSKNK